jgi:dienelactone hydrolase
MYGEGKQAQHPEDAGKFANEVRQNMEVGKARFVAAMDVLKKHPSVDPDRIAAIGYCFGGGIVLQMARSGTDLDGVVSFHGGLSTNEPAQQGMVKAKVLVCHGADDSFIPAGQVEDFRKEMEKAGADYRIISYAGATHSFTNPEADAYAEKFNIPVAYNEEADKKSWNDMQDFLRDVFRK